MGTIFNHLIQNMNHSYQQLVNQMTRIDDFFGAPQAQVRPIVQPQVVMPIQNERITLEENTVNQGQQFVPRVVEQERLKEVNRLPVLVVSRNQDAYQVVQGVR